MIRVGLLRSLADYGTRRCVGGLLPRNPTIGRQGKSAASGRAHMVGRLEFLGLFNNRASWRFNSKPERFQRYDRRRCPAEPALTP
jgi:hypothetical protein